MPTVVRRPIDDSAITLALDLSHIVCPGNWRREVDLWGKFLNAGYSRMLEVRPNQGAVYLRSRGEAWIEQSDALCRAGPRSGDDFHRGLSCFSDFGADALVATPAHLVTCPTDAGWADWVRLPKKV